MGEVVNAIVAFAVIVIIVRWVTSGSSSSSSESRSATTALGFRPKNVTPEMVDQIHTMFPDIPPDNIRFDLLRTGSVELTSNKILERGYLEAPPAAYFTLYPPVNAVPAPRPSDSTARTASTSASATAYQPSLISRYNLQDRLSTPNTEEAEGIIDAGGKATWEDTAEKRETSLRERKAQMILAARQRMLAQHPAAAGPSS